jgi:multimeric flavodoxin WrbA
MSSAGTVPPGSKRRLLIVYHTQFGATRQMAEAACRGARAIDEVETTLMHASQAVVDDLLNCDALLVATSENFGSLSGMVKDFFERVYYPCEGKVDGKPYTVLVCASNDGAGAMMHTDRIATGLHLAKANPGLIYKSGLIAQAHAVPEATLAACAEIGGTLAAGIAAGIF